VIPFVLLKIATDVIVPVHTVTKRDGPLDGGDQMTWYFLEITDPSDEIQRLGERSGEHHQLDIGREVQEDFLPDAPSILIVDKMHLIEDDAVHALHAEIRRGFDAHDEIA